MQGSPKPEELWKQGKWARQGGWVSEQEEGWSGHG